MELQIKDGPLIFFRYPDKLSAAWKYIGEFCVLYDGNTYHLTEDSYNKVLKEIDFAPFTKEEK